MPGNDLSRLGPRTFEDMVQALSFAEFGAGGVVYSPGPDGGRDFVYTGAIKGYTDWHGTLVIQAKYRETLEGGAKDVAWLTGQLKGEYDKLKALGDVDYYIIATNVALSGADGKGAHGRRRTGGFSKIAKELDSWKLQVGLKGTDVWPAQKIDRLIDQHDKIRRKYACWTMAGDVLARLSDVLNGVSPNFDTIARRVLAEGLEKDRLSRLEDAGEEIGRKLPLDATFVDLPLSPHHTRGAAPTNTLGGHELLLSRPVLATDPNVETALVQLLERSRCSFSSREIAPLHNEQSLQDHPSNRVVLLGGPGQGKSTVTAFLLQVLRSHILGSDPTLRGYDGQLPELTTRILKRAEAEGVKHEPPRRYPVHVDLARYADSLANIAAGQGVGASILDYLAGEFQRAANQVVDRETLRRWLGAYPWVLVLDGLDEVPTTTSRAGVLHAIREFAKDVVDVRGDVLIVVTTRPQGYNQDLDPEYWDHWTLDDLEQSRALRYAASLTAARHPGNAEKQAESKRIFDEAAKSDAISALMKSPLQVTILNVISAAGDALPAARWTLFNDYYATLKKREARKRGVGEIIGTNGPHIDAIHHIAGRRLHLQAEADGGASAYFTKSDFSTLVRDYLAKKGFLGDELDQMTENISRAALQRLVLLSAREEDRIRFDVRSLQEYTAALSLTIDIANLRENLAEMAKSAHWRHVLMIAASRCFADSVFEGFQDTVLGLASRLDVDPADQAAMNGARLALELYCDGVAAEFPIARRLLAQSALTLIEVKTDDFDDRILRLFTGHSRDLALARLRTVLKQSAESSAWYAAWRVALALASQDDPEATRIALDCWPAKEDTWPNLLSQVLRWRFPVDLAEVIADTLVRLRPTQAQHLVRSLRAPAPNSMSEPLSSAFTAIDMSSLRPAFETGFLASAEHNSSFRLTFSPVSPSKEDLTTINRLCSSGPWAFFGPCRRFWNNPSSSTLADAVGGLKSQQDLDEAKKLMWLMPWPLGEAIRQIETIADIEPIARKAIAGAFGDVEDWKRAEIRLHRYGVSREDILTRSDNGWSIPEVHRIGMPSIYGVSVGSDGEKPEVVELFLTALQLPDGRAKQNLVEIVTFALRHGGQQGRVPWTPDTILSLLKELDRIGSEWALTDAIQASTSALWKDRSLRHWIATRMVTGALDCMLTETPEIEQLVAVVREMEQDASVRGLLVPLAGLIVEAPSVLVPEGLLRHDVTDVSTVAAIRGVIRVVKSGTATRNDIDTITKLPMTKAVRRVIEVAAPFMALPKDELLQLFVRLIEVTEEAEPERASTLRSSLKSALDRRRPRLLPAQ